MRQTFQQARQSGTAQRYPCRITITPIGLRCPQVPIGSQHVDTQRCCCAARVRVSQTKSGRQCRRARYSLHRRRGSITRIPPLFRCLCVRHCVCSQLVQIELTGDDCHFTTCRHWSLSPVDLLSSIWLNVLNAPSYLRVRPPKVYNRRFGGAILLPQYYCVIPPPTYRDAPSNFPRRKQPSAPAKSSAPVDQKVSTIVH